MIAHLRPALVLMVLFTLLTGLIYPLAITGIAQAVFPSIANGSLIERDGKVVGSSLIGQSFTDAKYFWPRPSATSGADPNDPAKTVSSPYNAAASSGSNKGPTAKDLLERVADDVARLKETASGQPIPVDAVTASGSGLDPHISPAHAELQVVRVAKARGLSEVQVRAVVAQHTNGRVLGLIGEPTVNVLLINLALDGLARGGAR
jgi:potassium-transporting ATPase KdpC subunit